MVDVVIYGSASSCIYGERARILKLINSRYGVFGCGFGSTSPLPNICHQCRSHW